MVPTTSQTQFTQTTSNFLPLQQIYHLITPHTPSCKFIITSIHINFWTISHHFFCQGPTCTTFLEVEFVSLPDLVGSPTWFCEAAKSFLVRVASSAPISLSLSTSFSPTTFANHQQHHFRNDHNVCCILAPIRFSSKFNY
jgi:hypothetical protein